VLTVETKSHWTIVECALSTETQSDIIQVREGSQLTYVRYDPLDCSRRDAVVAYVHENSEFQMTRIARSRAQHRVETKIVLSDRDARAVLRELNFVENGAEYTTVSDVRHEAPGTVSRVLAKNIVEGGGRSSFDGTVHVGPAAEHAVADQKNYNLLLNDASRAISIPRLKIDHPSVRCTHGATTQYLDDEILFYMSTRGIPSSRARQLFLEGFVADILDALGPLRPFFSLRSG
jgi:Fe-S cluster assembly protein SufD